MENNYDAIYYAFIYDGFHTRTHFQIGHHTTKLFFQTRPIQDVTSPHIRPLYLDLTLFH